MKNVLVILLSLVLTLGCDDKKEEHKDCDCHPVAGEMMDAGVDAGEEVDAGEQVDAGEEVEDMEMPEAGSSDVEMPEAGVMDAEVPCECEADMMCDC